jgi:CRP-like cAMP-binding protein
MSEWVTNKVPFGVGQDLFREGQPPRDAYLIERGRVQISKTSGEEKIILGYREAGDVVGEMALIDNQPRSATATAVEPTVCVVITSKLFNDHMARATPLLRRILVTFTRNLRDMSKRA